MSPPPFPFLETFAHLRRCLYGVVDATYGALGLGATQAKLLRRIGENRNLSQADLARATGTDPALTGRALQTLLDRGWVQRRRSRADRRAFSLELTPSGEALLREVLEAREEVAHRVRSCLNEEDLTAFDRIARKLLATFEGQVREQGSAKATRDDAGRPVRKKTSRAARGTTGKGALKSRAG
jgi:DNA-binding MarR family transcriptional regulator